jgi:hypothetical protein
MKIAITILGGGWGPTVASTDVRFAYVVASLWIRCNVISSITNSTDLRIMLLTYCRGDLNQISVVTRTFIWLTETILPMVSIDATVLDTIADPVIITISVLGIQCNTVGTIASEQRDAIVVFIRKTPSPHETRSYQRAILRRSDLTRNLILARILILHIRTTYFAIDVMLDHVLGTSLASQNEAVLCELLRVAISFFLGLLSLCVGIICFCFGVRYFCPGVRYFRFGFRYILFGVLYSRLGVC